MMWWILIIPCERPYYPRGVGGARWGDRWGAWEDKRAREWGIDMLIRVLLKFFFNKKIMMNIFSTYPLGICVSSFKKYLSRSLLFFNHIGFFLIFLSAWCILDINLLLSKLFANISLIPLTVPLFVYYFLFCTLFNLIQDHLHVMFYLF